MRTRRDRTGTYIAPSAPLAVGFVGTNVVRVPSSHPDDSTAACTVAVAPRCSAGADRGTNRAVPVRDSCGGLATGSELARPLPKSVGRAGRGRSSYHARPATSPCVMHLFRGRGSTTNQARCRRYPRYDRRWRLTSDAQNPGEHTLLRVQPVFGLIERHG